MKAILTISDEKDYLLKCPFCEYESEENLQLPGEDSYVKHSMLWCEECGARSILDNPNVVDEGEREVELCKILKVINHELCYFIPKREITQDIIREFIENGYDDSTNFSNASKVYIDHEDDVDFSIGLECLSYNVIEPSIKYPKYFEMDDDDSYIFLECQNSAGTVFRTCYSVGF